MSFDLQNLWFYDCDKHIQATLYLCVLFTDVEVDVPSYGRIKVDVGYGGAFYALVPGQALGLDVRTARAVDVMQAATAVSGNYLFYNIPQILILGHGVA